MSIGNSRTIVTESNPDAILSIDDVIDRYTGKWILMRVTLFDEDGWPEAGYVTAHAATQRELLDEMERQLPTPSHEGLPIHTFLAEVGVYIKDPAAIRALIAELAAPSSSNRV